MAKKKQKVWLITGSSTGLGRALAETAIKRGELVVATARQPIQLSKLVAQNPETALAVGLDVTKPREVREAVRKTLDTFDRIDVLVNNAGYGAMGALEEVSDEAIRRQFETNVFGALEVMRAVLPTMRKQRSGHILNISSVGGFVALGGLGLYNATKFALEGLSEALASETAPLGIKVTIVEPGAFRTDWAGRSLVLPERQIDDYASTSGQCLKWIQDMHGQELGDPNKAAEAMIEVVDSENPPLRLVLGSDALQAISDKLQFVSEEISAWKPISLNTAFEG